MIQSTFTVNPTVLSEEIAAGVVGALLHVAPHYSVQASRDIATAVAESVLENLLLNQVLES